MSDDWWGDNQSDEQEQDRSIKPHKDTATLTLKANRSPGNFLILAVISIFGSGFITNPVSEMEFFPQEYVFFITMFGILFLAILIILLSIWSRLNKQWSRVTMEGNEISLQRYLPFKIRLFSHKQIKSEVVDVVIMEKVYVEIKGNDDSSNIRRGGYWNYRVELMDENNITLAYFSLENDEWEPFAVGLSGRLDKELIREK